MSVYGAQIVCAEFVYTAIPFHPPFSLTQPPTPGAGCGLPGLICARLCGASSVTLTDFWEAEENKEREDLVRLLPDFLFATNLHYNVDLNGLADIVSVERLDWHDPSNLGDFDLIVGSDLVYNIYDVLPLLSVVDR